jgi:Na+/serine symporter
MRKLSLIKQLLIGLLLGIIITPAQPAQAQWTVFDPTSYAAQIEEMAR